MNTLTLTETTVKQQVGDILLDITWSKIASLYFEKSPSWLYHKLDGIDGNGGKSGFSSGEKKQLRNALLDLSERIRIAAENIAI